MNDGSDEQRPSQLAGKIVWLLYGSDKIKLDVYPA